MRRVWWTVAIAAAVSGFSAPEAGRAALPDSVRAAGTVNGVSLSRNAGFAEVAIGVTGDVDVEDFSLQAPHRIVVDLFPAKLGVLPSVYDGIVRGGITSVRVAQYNDTTVRVVLDLDRRREYDVTQEDGNVLVAFPATEEFEPWNLGAPLRVAPAVAPAPAAVAPVRAANVSLATPPASPLPQVGERITLSVRDTDLRDVLAIFAERSGRSIVTAINNVRITADINDQPWPVALQSILSAYGLAAYDDPASRIITVTTAAEQQAQRAFEPVVSVRLPLNYARATELAPTITSLLSPDCGTAVTVPTVGSTPPAGAAAGDAGATGGATAAGAAGTGAQSPPASGAVPSPTLTPGTCVTRGRVVAEPTTNTLVIFETASRMDSLVAFARSFDLKPQQVNIKAQIISINRTNTSRLGVSYDLGSPDAFFNTLAPRASTAGQSEFQVTLGGDAFAGVANANRNFASTAAINLLYNTTIGNFSLTSFLDALAQEELTDVQAVPSVNTLDKKTASLFVGNTISFLLTPPTAPGAIQAATPQIDQTEVGIRLNVTPSISANRTIRLAVAAEQSSLLQISIAGPNSSTTLVNNEVLVNDGETVVVSGLIQKTISKTRRGIPLLMNLPLLGRLFSENESIETNDDLIILITARILDDPIPSGR
jgi:type IV pilus assembly protein PilQ